MLRVYEDAKVVCRGVSFVVEEVARRDKSLADQMRRAVVSVLLNIAEGDGSLKGNRRVRFSTALGSARETLACLEAAVAMRYLDGVDEELRDRLEKVVASLVNLVRRS